MSRPVFVSYSRKDSACVAAVVQALENDDFSVWMDKRSIAPGMDWISAIIKGVETAGAFLLIWSRHAQDSKYVAKEIEIAQRTAFQHNLPVFIVQLDDTPLPAAFDHVQAVDFRGGCDDIAIGFLLRALPAELRVFSHVKPLGKQHHTAVDRTLLVSVPFQQRQLEHSSLRAAVVGRPELVVKMAPPQLAICLQFTRGTNENMLAPIWQLFTEDEAFCALHIQGPQSTDGTRFELANGRQVDWEQSARFIVDTIACIATPESTHLSFFMQAPAALTARVGMNYWRFWEIDFYNYAPEDKDRPYKSVLSVARNAT